MKRLAKTAIMIQLISEMSARESWCGETHVQKATLFLQDLLEVPLDLDFVLYRHGPFSFDLRDELTAMRADGLLKLQPQRHYGPKIVLSERSGYVKSLYSKTVQEYEKDIEFVAETIGIRGVVELERLATALFITLHLLPSGSARERTKELTRIKPHISNENAASAVREIDQIISSLDC